MSCKPCSLLTQYILNIAIAIDRAACALTLGSPNETISQRTARARLAGERWAAVACGILTAASRIFGATGDHCTNSLTPGTSGLELWDWSPSQPPSSDKRDLQNLS